MIGIKSLRLSFLRIFCFKGVDTHVNLSFFRSPKQFSLVVYTNEKDEEEETVIPCNWLVEIEGMKTLLYPPKNAASLAKACSTIQDDWRPYKVLKVKHTGDRESCENYNFTSACESPVKKKIVSKLVEVPATNESQSEIDESFDPGSPSSNASSGSDHDGTPPQSTPKNVNSVMSKFPIKEEHFQYFVCKALEKLLRRQEQCTCQRGDRSPEPSTPRNNLVQNKTLEDFDAFDEKLKDTEFKKSIIHALCMKVSDSSRRHIVNGMVQCLMSNSLQDHFSWKGQGTKKKALIGTEMYDALVDAIRKSVKDQLNVEPTEGDIGKDIGLCLVHAKNRKSVN